VLARVNGTALRDVAERKVQRKSKYLAYIQ